MSQKLTTPEQIAELGKLIRKIEHPDLTNEEALEKELNIKGCVVSWINENGINLTKPVENLEELEVIKEALDHNFAFVSVKILGLPITLSRIMNVINDPLENICVWKLLQNNSLLDATAEYQTQKTILSIINLLKS